MRIGYIRVSTSEQNVDRQVDLLQDKYAVEKMYIDKVSGKNTDRPELQAMLEFVREGDAVFISSISRLARNTRDFLEMAEDFNTRGVGLVSDKENINTTTPQGKAIATIFASMYELERESILQRQREGIESAMKRGVKFGRKKVEAGDQFEELYAQWQRGEMTAVECMNKLGLKKTTFYRRVKEHKESLNIA